MSSIKEIVLYSYYYSSASWRVRAALAHKNVPFNYETVQLLDGAQHSNDYLKVNPMHQVPTLKLTLNDGKSHVITQSLAIIKYLEFYLPHNPIYPRDPLLRAQSEAIAETISGGIQPLQNLETLVHYAEPLGGEALTPEERKKVAQFWLNRKLANLEKLVAKTSGRYCIGDILTIADFCLVPQMFNARRFEVDTSKFPKIKAIDERLQELDIFKMSHPLACPDAPQRS